MRGTTSRDGSSTAGGSFWFVRLLGLGFVGLGLLFLMAPRAGAAVFGLSAPEGESLSYLPAIGLRDLAFGLYLLILSFTATQRILGLIFAATLVIPMGDLIIVAAAHGSDAIPNLLLHGVSAAVMAAGSIWLLKSSTHDKTGGNT
jgi:hypothetical protein